MNYDYICLEGVRTFRSGENILIYQCKNLYFFTAGIQRSDALMRQMGALEAGLKCYMYSFHLSYI